MHNKVWANIVSASYRERKRRIKISSMSVSDHCISFFLPSFLSFILSFFFLSFRTLWLQLFLKWNACIFFILLFGDCFRDTVKEKIHAKKTEDAIYSFTSLHQWLLCFFMDGWMDGWIEEGRGEFSVLVHREGCVFIKTAEQQRPLTAEQELITGDYWGFIISHVFSGQVHVCT